MRRVLGLVVLGLGLPQVASAAPDRVKLPPGEKSPSGEADRLFAEGQAALEDKDYATACALFERSKALEPALGTMLNLATCYEAWGRLASAREEFDAAREAAGRAGQVAFADAALERISLLEPRIPRLIVYPTPTVEGLTISLRGGGYRERTVEAGAYTYVDPSGSATGLYTLTVEIAAPGYETWTETYAPSEAEPVRSIKHQLVPLPEGAVPASTGAVAAAPTVDAPRPAWSGRKKLGLGLLGGGAAMLATGVALNLVWRSDGSAPDADDEQAQAANDKMRWIGTPIVGAGVALAAVGTYLLVTGGARRTGREAARTTLVPTTNATGAGVAVVGSF
ncbi:MAG: hypothetical protein R2939_01665 [Kofleriaceae bacterium]